MDALYVGVRELKNRLSEYLREVKKGRSIIITQWGKPIGMITPRTSKVEDRMERMVEAGLVAWNGKMLEQIEPAGVNRSPQMVSDVLVELRE